MPTRFGHRQSPRFGRKRGQPKPRPPYSGHAVNLSRVRISARYPRGDPAAPREAGGHFRMRAAHLLRVPAADARTGLEDESGHRSTSLRPTAVSPELGILVVHSGWRSAVATDSAAA